MSKCPIRWIKKAIKKILLLGLGKANHKKLVVICMPRTGSNMLISLLNSHKRVALQYESFSDEAPHSSAEIWKNIFKPNWKWIKYLGFKLFYHHRLSEDESVWDLLKSDNSVYIIHLRRRDLLRVYVSNALAKKSGIWAHKYQIPRSDEVPKKINVDIQDCVTTVNAYLSWEKDHSQEHFPGHPYLEVFYEDIIDNYDSEIERILAFLEIKRQALRSKFKKQNQKHTRDLIEDYDKVLTSLQAQFPANRFQGKY